VAVITSAAGVTDSYIRISGSRSSPLNGYAPNDLLQLLLKPHALYHSQRRIGELVERNVRQHHRRKPSSTAENINATASLGPRSEQVFVIRYTFKEVQQPKAPLDEQVFN
jgi:hypothetical protein